MLQIPAISLNPQVVVYLVLASFVLGYALGWLGRPEREEFHYDDDYVSSDTLSNILRVEAKKGYRS